MPHSQEFCSDTRSFWISSLVWCFGNWASASMGGDANARAICSRAYKKVQLFYIAFLSGPPQGNWSCWCWKGLSIFYLSAPASRTWPLVGPVRISLRWVVISPLDISSGGTIGWVGGKEAAGVKLSTVGSGGTVYRQMSGGYWGTWTGVRTGLIWGLGLFTYLCICVPKGLGSILALMDALDLSRRAADISIFVV